MIDIESVLQAADHELRASGTVGAPTCRAFAQATDAARRGLDPCFEFLGCGGGSPGVAGPAGAVVPVERRVDAVRLMLLRLGAQTGAPRWSSHVLEQLFEAALRPPGAETGDIVRALYRLLGERPDGLTTAQANFIREVGVHVVGRHRRTYASQNFAWLAEVLAVATPVVTPAQAYLAAAILPPAFAPQCRDEILNSLRGTEFEAQVAHDLAD